MIRVLLFDAAGTLFHLPRGVGAHYAEVARRHGSDLAPGALESAFRAAWKRAAPVPETRTPRPDDDRAWWRALAGEAFAACGDPHVIDRCFDDLWEHFAQPGVWELFPEVRGVLQTLAATHRLGIVSNFDSRLHRILASLGIDSYFEHVIVSSEAGAEKPSAHIFQVALQRFGLAPHEALHIGDDPEADWHGATAAGLHAFKLRRPENSLAAVPPSLQTIS
jgi:putative hydrolase of the HAD superfamily